MYYISRGYASVFGSLIVVLQLSADLLQINRCVQWAVAVCMDNSCFLACPIILTSLRHFLLVGTFSELNEVLSWSSGELDLDNMLILRCCTNIGIWELNIVSCLFIYAKAWTLVLAMHRLLLQSFHRCRWILIFKLQNLLYTLHKIVCLQSLFHV